MEDKEIQTNSIFRDIVIVLKHFPKANLKVQIYNRANLLISVFTTPIWTILQLVLLSGIYLYTDSFGGFSKLDSLVIIATYRVITGLADLIFMNKFYELVSSIKGGDSNNLDNSLSKPINPQVLTTLGGFDLSSLVNIFIGIGLILLVLTNSPKSTNLETIILTVVIIIVGVILIYSTYLILVCLHFYFELHEAQIMELHSTFRQVSKFPSNIFSSNIKNVLIIIFPFLLMGSVQADLLLNKTPLVYSIVYILVGLLYLSLSILIWQLSIKKYSSFGG